MRPCRLAGDNLGCTMALSSRLRRAHALRQAVWRGELLARPSRWGQLRRRIGSVPTAGCLLNGFYHLIGSEVMDHMAQSRDGNKFAPRQFLVKPLGLAASVDDLIVRARHDHHGRL